MNIRIFLIDEHGPAREMLARRLESVQGLEVVGSTSNSEAAIRDVVALCPDLVLIDPKMKQADGIDVCRRLLATGEQTKVVVLTSYLDPEERRQVYEAGVDGYLLKIVDTGSLSDWIRLAVEREPT